MGGHGAPERQIRLRQWNLTRFQWFELCPPTMVNYPGEREDMAHAILWICERAAESLTVVHDLISDCWPQPQKADGTP